LSERVGQIKHEIRPMNRLLTSTETTGTVVRVVLFVSIPHTQPNLRERDQRRDEARREFERVFSRRRRSMREQTEAISFEHSRTFSAIDSDDWSPSSEDEDLGWMDDMRSLSRPVRES
jgi:hypothetical protein